MNINDICNGVEGLLNGEWDCHKVASNKDIYNKYWDITVW